MSNDAAEMPKYKCYKEVWALKIKDIDLTHKDGPHIIPEESGYGPVLVSLEFIQKHSPRIGGYYVVYADGYKSFSPAFAFEKGYTRI